jgi:uncharacterized membrane protein YbhN (UPF0104 family)
MPEKESVPDPSGVDEATGLDETHGSRWRTIAMIVGTLLALAALLNEIPSVSDLWDTIKTADWWWVALAVAFTLGNKVGYALALMGSVAKRLPLVRSVEALLAAAFSNLAVPGVGGTAVQVRYLQCQGVELASAVAAGAVLANVANVVVQGALFLVALLFTSQSIDTGKLDLHDAASTLLLVVFLAGVCVAVAYGVPSFRRRTLPPTKRGVETIRTALRSPRQIVLLVVGNLVAALMSALCLFACVKAYGGSVHFWSLLVANIVVGTVASLIPIPGGNTLVSAVGLSGALIMLGVPETAAVAAVITQQLVATYLPALPGWFATEDLLRHRLL